MHIPYTGKAQNENTVPKISGIFSVFFRQLSAYLGLALSINYGGLVKSQPSRQKQKAKPLVQGAARGQESSTCDRVKEAQQDKGRHDAPRK